ncbi:response regulator [Nakamurella flava]|jgi:DNA-binding NtrC family response regulator|uniref:Response regulator n=1 Tax=Nakamurella flava TaxID=2576308 RepID=A0A4U6QM39_9ACTN|nr:response regulator [Nakamurella flava]TKV61660.1 response regulator [Nakamurella flava]
MSRRALVVDDDAVSRLVLGHMLRGLQWTVEQAVDAPDAASHLDNAEFDLVISDFLLPSGTGVDVLRTVERRHPGTAFVLVTGFIEHSTLPPETTARLSGQLTKPVSSDTLRTVLDELFPAAGTP